VFTGTVPHNQLQRLRLPFVLVANPSSPAARFGQLTEREQRGEWVQGTWAEGTGPRRRMFAYRSAADVPLTSRSRSASWRDFERTNREQ
jgi:hypothetical protein